ncbi:luciferin sulfotransferase-like isoform X1 [Calliphora vicina]|uniref:luciferin sulfotransferase-like isoform X1 n=1 Tax=Calliphora vicina TaxID=7373 RepID=UPI00325B3607
MFVVRAHSSDNIDKRQGRPFVEIAANGINIPLVGEQWLEHWCSLPITEDFFKRLYEFQVRDDDVYVVTFPKCGTTWIQETTWLLVNNLDFVKANAEDLITRSVFIDLIALYTEMPIDSIESADKASSPRVLKSHLPAHLIPKQIWEKKSKIIYCARNPKDMVVSYFHFHRGLGTWQGDINEFVEDISNNDIMYSPYWEHFMDFWRMREEENVFFTTYEDMKRDLRAVLIKLNKFLKKPDLSEEQLQQLEKHLSFDSMKANKRVNLTYSIKAGHGSPYVREDFQFMRRGIVGSHKDELSPQIHKKLDAWIAEHLKKYNVKLEDIFGSI